MKTYTIHSNGTYCDRDSLMVANCLTVDTDKIYWDVIFYPNPVSDVIHIEIERPSKYRLINSSGITVKEEAITTGDIFVGGLPIGMYYLTFPFDDGTFRSRPIMVYR